MYPDKMMLDNVLCGIKQLIANDVGLQWFFYLTDEATRKNGRALYLRVFWQVIYECTSEKYSNTIINDERIALLKFLSNKYHIDITDLLK